MRAGHDLDRKAASSLVWQAARVAVHLLQYVVLARLVVPAEFGKFALAAPLFLVLSAINDGGLSTATVTGRRYDAQLSSNLWWTQVAMGLLTASIMLVGAPLLEWTFGVNDLFAVCAGLALSLAIESWGLQSRASLRRDMRIGALALVEIGGLVLGVAAALFASQWTHGVVLVVIAQLVNAIGRTTIGLCLAPMRLRAFLITPEYRAALRTGWNVVGSDLLNVVRAQSPTLVIGYFMALGSVGLFARANQLVNLPLTMLSPALSNFLLPLLSRTREQAVAFHGHIRKTQRMFLAAAIPLSVWIALGPSHLIGFALGEEWTPVVPILQALSPLFMSQIMATVIRMSLLATEQSQVDRFFSFLNLGLTIVAVLAAAPFGVVPVALALSLSGLLVRAPLLAILAIRKGSLTGRDVADGILAIATFAVVTAVALWLIQLLPLSGLMRDIGGLVASGAISLIALLLVMRRPGAKERA